MWKRFGTPTKRAGSGTEEEFESAYEALISGIKKLQYVIFYFCQEKNAVPRTTFTVKQVGL
jgi:hypothetical protein